MTVAPSRIGAPRRRRRRESVILFSIGLSRFAIAAAAVQELKSTDSLAGVAAIFEHPSLLKVRHTVQRGRQTYYVISGFAHFGLPVTRPAMVFILRDYPAAVLVDAIAGMTEIHTLLALPLAFRGEERRWYRGLIYLDEQVVPLVNPAGFLSENEMELLEGEAAAVEADGSQGTISP